MKEGSATPTSLGAPLSQSFHTMRHEMTVPRPSPFRRSRDAGPNAGAKARAFDEWSIDDVAAFLDGVGLAGCRDAFRQHEIKGRHLTLLSKEDFKELGIARLGQRLALAKEIQKLKTREKIEKRSNIIEKRREAWDGTCLSLSCQTCGGLFPWDPDIYILTATNLRIKSFDFYRLCGIWKMTCCGGSWQSDNIPLHKIIDVDIEHYTRGWFPFKENKCIVRLQGVAGNDAEAETSRIQQREMLLEGKDGEEFQKRLRDTIEEFKLLVGPQEGKAD